MTPTPSKIPAQIAIAHPSSLSPTQILGIVTSAVTQDTPVVISAIPGASTSPVVAYVMLGEIGLEIVNQIVAAIQAAKSAQGAVQ